MILSPFEAYGDGLSQGFVALYSVLSPRLKTVDSICSCSKRLQLVRVCFARVEAAIVIFSLTVLHSMLQLRRYHPTIIIGAVLKMGNEYLYLRGKERRVTRGKNIMLGFVIYSRGSQYR